MNSSWASTPRGGGGQGPGVPLMFFNERDTISNVPLTNWKGIRIDVTAFLSACTHSLFLGAHEPVCAFSLARVTAFGK